MVTVRERTADRVWRLLDRVMDPEIPVVSVVELGIVRDVRETGDDIEVVITPTYSGCPATVMIETEIRRALDAGGFRAARVSTVLAPPWTTDWITDAAREKLRAYGIAPPVDGTAGKRALFADRPVIACPRCGGRDTELVSEFGSTACKSQYRCRTCLEPFDYFKCI